MTTDRPKAHTDAPRRLLLLCVFLVVALAALLMFRNPFFRTTPRMELHLVGFSQDTNGLLTAELQITNSGGRDLWLVPQVSVSYSTAIEMTGYDPIKGATLKPGAATNIVIRPAAGLKCQATVMAHLAWRVRVANVLTKMKLSPTVISSPSLEDWLGSDPVRARTDWIDAPLPPQLPPLR